MGSALSLLHEDGCPGEVGEACACGLVVAFVGRSAMVMVDSHYRHGADPINLSTVWGPEALDAWFTLIGCGQAVDWPGFQGGGEW